MGKVEFLQKISALATECHALACELDIGDERTECSKSMACCTTSVAVVTPAM